MFAGSHYTKFYTFFHARFAAGKTFFFILKYTSFDTIPDIITENSNAVKFMMHLLLMPAMNRAMAMHRLSILRHIIIYPVLSYAVLLK